MEVDEDERINEVVCGDSGKVISRVDALKLLLLEAVEADVGGIENWKRVK